jgi:hypothetical protein
MSKEIWNQNSFISPNSKRADLIGVVISNHSAVRYGVTVQIKSWVPAVQPRLILEGKQKFRILQTQERSDGTTWGKVLILDEGPSSLLPALPSTMVPPTQPRLKSFQKDFTTSWAPWTQPLYSPQRLLWKVKELCGHHGFDIHVIPPDPSAASYWIAKNLVLDDPTRLELLSLQTAERLMVEIDILKRSKICCLSCKSTLATTGDIFSMSREGPQSCYVNRSGYLHDTITLRKLSIRPILWGRPCIRDTWFPGYAWIIILCPACHSHLGWKYISTKDNLSPSVFWGLARASLTMTM